MADACLATAAAPTFFDPVRILEKILVDGGYGETNNPSRDAWQHYTELKEICHTDRVRWINIGTGTFNGQAPPSKREWKDLFLPRYVQNIMHTIRDLEKIATDSENIGVSMRLISDMDRSQLDFYRFSATNGVHTIALDDYLTIDNKELERLTMEYLSEPKVEEELRTLARSLADDYMEKTQPSKVVQDSLLVPEPSSIRQLVTGGEPDDPDYLPPGTGVPSMAGVSEATAESSNTNEIAWARNAGLEDPVSTLPLQSDRIGVGDQFKTPHFTVTGLGPPIRSSTAPAKV